MNKFYFRLRCASGTLNSFRKVPSSNLFQKGGHGIFNCLQLLFLVTIFLAGTSSFSQTNYYSKSTATDFNTLSSWGTSTDGSGTAPTSFTNADNYFVANSAILNLSANATIRELNITAGTLNVASNSLTISKGAGFNDSKLAISIGTCSFGYS